MLNIALVLEKIVHRFNHRPLTEQNLVSVSHEFVLHILFQLRDQLNSAFFPQHEPEIFYCLLAYERGKDYAAEAVTEWTLTNYDIPYLIGTVEENNAASQRVLEKCGDRYIDTRTLLVHITEQSYTFKYYRRYPCGMTKRD